MIAEYDVVVLYAKKTKVSAISLDPSDPKEQMIAVRQLKTAVAVDFSFEDQYVYWSDVSADTISRRFLNGSGYETIISDGNILVSIFCFRLLDFDCYEEYIHIFFCVRFV